MRRSQLWPLSILDSLGLKLSESGSLDRLITRIFLFEETGFERLHFTSPCRFSLLPFPLGHSDRYLRDCATVNYVRPGLDSEHVKDAEALSGVTHC